MRRIDADALQEEKEGRAVSNARVCLATSVSFIAGGTFLSWKGYMAAHPLWCPFRRVIKNNMACKILSPVCGAGALVAATGVVQSMTHIGEWSDASKRRADIVERLATMRAEREALIETTMAEAKAADEKQ